jgi:EAL domain-containing protein (putative c-di-GMP-specific phosphodiesterase class I)/GGDEF domain-containing protein
VTAPLPPNPASAAVPDAATPETRDELLRLLDRETAIARATNGKLAVLILELRRVDRLQALLRGPSPGITMSLVLDRLRKVLRPEDRMAPISDEQVCVILPRLAHSSQAVLAAVKLLRALDRPIAHEGGSAALRPCVGVATVPEHGFDPAQLLMAADVSRHIAANREEGYHIHQGEDSVEQEVYRGLDLDLNRALRANELDVHYQPQLDLATGRAVGAEALVRWRHEKAGDIPPATIVGIAERTGLIGVLTHWVLNAVLRQAAQWQAASMMPRISMNIAVSSLNDRELPGLIDQGIKTWGVAPAQLTLEVAESPLMVDAERTVAVLTRLKALGVQISVDDFGSGFSSLGSLKRLPLDEIKIDRPFVGGLESDAGDRAVVRTAIDLGHHFNLRVVAEGVEKASTTEALRELGCDIAQGNVISAALPAVAFRDWWATHAGT